MISRQALTILEAIALAALLMFGGSPALRVLIGLPILGHIAWGVLTSIPVGSIPGPPPGVGERRRNHRLRYRVVEFLREVKRIEAFARRATERGEAKDAAVKDLQRSEKRLHEIVSEIMRVAGQTGA